MKSYTDLEQSKKLAEFLPLETADMYYWCGEDLRIGSHKAMDLDYDIPCWSLAALFNMLPKSARLERGSSTELCRVTLPVELKCSDWYLEPIDAVFEIVCWSLKNDISLSFK